MNHWSQVSHLREENSKLLQHLKAKQYEFKSLLKGINSISNASEGDGFVSNLNSAVEGPIYSASLQKKQQNDFDNLSNFSGCGNFTGNGVVNNASILSDISVENQSKSETARRRLAYAILDRSVSGEANSDASQLKTASINEKDIKDQRSKIQTKLNMPIDNNYSNVEKPQENARTRTPVRFDVSSDVSDMENSFKNRTSTPNKSLQAEGQETPKSILKHRKIIEDNVYVPSHYDESFIKSKKSNTNGLNFSYSNVDDLELKTLLPSYTKNKFDKEKFDPLKTKSSFVKSDSISKKPPKYLAATNGSYLEDLPDDVPSSKSDKKSEEISKLNESIKQSVLKDTIENNLHQCNMLLDSGNDRQNAPIVRDIINRPKSFVFAREDNLNDLKIMQPSVSTKDNNSKFKKFADFNANNSNSFAHNHVKTTSEASFAHNQKQPNVNPLLGYDWIAGVLDNQNSILEQPEEYYENLRDFRRKHKDFCMTQLPPRQALKLTSPDSPDIKDPGHTCIHGYIVNDRLFAKPINVDDVGQSICPVCLVPRKEPTAEEPGFVRVSIPRSTLESPYRVRPHRRNSFDPSDSCALSEHCLAGWECAKPASLPAAGSVNLKAATDGLTSRMATTMDEIKDLIKPFSDRGRVLEANVLRYNGAQGNMKHSQAINSGVQGDTELSLENNSTFYGSSQTTDNLLNTSYGLHYDLELMRQTRPVMPKLSAAVH